MQRSGPACRVVNCGWLAVDGGWRPSTLPHCQQIMGEHEKGMGVVGGDLC